MQRYLVILQKCSNSFGYTQGQHSPVVILQVGHQDIQFIALALDLIQVQGWEHHQAYITTKPQIYSVREK